MAKSGETLLVTEREEVVAELRPARRQPLRSSTLEDTLDVLAESGEIQRASESRKNWRWRPRGLGLPARAVARIIDEVREDR
jgi:antitoxin (DNA-binding transcriptional repressor) of toxin-antitoxin stability system